jgi:hypothetical protein
MSNGLAAKSYFCIHDACVYIEVLCVQTSECFMLYIPSKYEIKPPSNCSDVYTMDYMDIGEDGYIPGDYGGEPTDIALEKSYDEIDFEEDPEKGDMVGHLEGHYNHPLALKDVSTNDIMELRDVFRQLRRLKLCLQSVKYKLCISFKNFMCCIRRDDTFEGYIVKNWSNTDTNRRLTVTLDLESAYAKFESIHRDIGAVKEGVYAVLDKNQGKHSRSLGLMMEKRELLVDSAVRILRKKAEYMSYVERLKGLTKQVNLPEKNMLEKLFNLRSDKGSNDIKAFHSDVERTHQIVQCENELDRMASVKKELLANLKDVGAKYENVVLKVDKILFDNSVMLDAILKNLTELERM